MAEKSGYYCNGRWNYKFKKKKKEKPQRGEHSKKYQKTSDLPRQGTKPHYIDETLAENNSLFFKK